MSKRKSSKPSLIEKQAGSSEDPGVTLNRILKVREIFEKEEAAGIKHDALKPRWSLVPLNVMREVIAVLEHGAKKYSCDNWQKVVNGEDRYYDAAMRHIEARRLGEINDPESQRPHLAHALCCLIFWLWFDLKNRRGHR